MNRRQVLAGFAAGVPFFAGCSALSGDGGDGTGNDTGTTGQNETTPTETATPTAVGTTLAETTQEMVTQTATATPTQTPTPTSTPTRSPTATPTPVPTATPTAQQTTGPVTTSGGTTVTGGTTGVPVIDPSNLTTYTSDTYPFSVKYPASWRVDETPPVSGGVVAFFAPADGSRMLVQVIEGAPRSVSLDTFVSAFIDGLRQEFSEDGVDLSLVNKRDVTLPNGHLATVVDMRLTDTANEVVRFKTILTIVDRTVYVVHMAVLKSSYTSTVERGANEILTSLTISDSPTATL